MTRIHGILVSYRRPGALARSLDAIEGSSVQPDELLVVDHEATDATTAVVEAAARRAPWIRHLPVERNLGPAGGRALGMEHVVPSAADEDWITLFDDDDPLPHPQLLGLLSERASELAGRSGRIGGVGLRGSTFDRRRGYPVPVELQHDRDAPVDYLHGGFFPCYRVGAVRAVGPFRSSLFFGWADLEYGLRLRRAGYELWMAVDLWRRDASSMGHPSERVRPALGLEPADARRYYRMRNWFRLLPEYAGWPTTARVFALAGLAKPIMNLPVQPLLAWRHLRLNVRAGWDAARGVEGPDGPNCWTGVPSGVEEEG